MSNFKEQSQAYGRDAAIKMVASFPAVVSVLPIDLIARFFTCAYMDGVCAESSANLQRIVDGIAPKKAGTDV